MASKLRWMAATRKRGSARTPAAVDGSDDAFFGDLVVDLVPDRPQRIPSVGPGAKIVHARAGVGNADVPVRFLHDAADNWFVTGDAVGGPVYPARVC